MAMSTWITCSLVASGCETFSIFDERVDGFCCIRNFDVDVIVRSFVIRTVFEGSFQIKSKHQELNKSFPFGS